MTECNFHDPRDEGRPCGMQAGYGVTYAMGRHGRLSFKVCKTHWEYYLSDMENFILDNEQGWGMYLKATK